MLRHAPAAGSVAALALAGCVLVSCVADADEMPDTAVSDTAVSDTAPADAAPADSDTWALPNRDLWNGRANPDTRIGSATIDGLAERWRLELAGRPLGSASSTPIVVDDTVYYGDTGASVYALDRTTGELRWQVDGAGGGPGPNGVVVNDGVVYASDDGTGIRALSADDGAERWSTDLVDAGGLVNIAPVVADGLVLAATSASGEPGARGTLFALDADTGAIVWSFDTIVSDDLWGHPEINSGGGAWFPPAVDLAAGRTYWGTSNPYPFPGAPGYPNGSSRPGDNRWTQSTLALDLATGELAWGHQAVPHDLFDRDAVLTALADTDDDGAPDVVIGTGKHARVLGLSTDGELLWDTPIGLHDNDDVTEFDGELVVLPGMAGGVVTPPTVADGVVYVVVANVASPYAGPDDPAVGLEFDAHDSDLVALDAATGEILWERSVPGDAFGGATVASDLVLTSTLDGLLLAHDRADGREVWRLQLPAGINGWPAVTDDELIVPVAWTEPPLLVSLALPD
ncbi:MAG: PQQ-binding-like beta-propeller repeat protein [Actinomycetota bacterium]|nr:PQQ-binding-like beta-propeller repeat protein [Actinomycetota bacterium]